MPKLLDRDPTQEMIEAADKAWINFTSRTFTDIFQSMYDAAPEVKQEPVEIDWPEYHYEAMGCGLEDRGITDKYDAMRYGWDEAIERCAERIPKKLFELPPDAQAEIAKRDERIKELESNINAFAREQAQKMLNNGAYSDKVNQQAAEISRLKALVGQCKEVLEDSHQNINQERRFASEIEQDIEQTLAAIREEGL